MSLLLYEQRPGAVKPGSITTLEPVKEDDAGGGPLLGFKNMMSAQGVGRFTRSTIGVESIPSQSSRMSPSVRS